MIVGQTSGNDTDCRDARRVVAGEVVRHTSAVRESGNVDPLRIYPRMRGCLRYERSDEAQVVNVITSGDSAARSGVPVRAVIEYRTFPVGVHADDSKALGDRIEARL